MFKSLIVSITIMAALATGAIPSLAAKTHPVVKRTPTNSGYVYLTKGLVPGHRYRISVQSTGKTHFGGTGFENYTWIYKQHAGESTKSLTFTGNTPKTFVLTQPVSAKLVSWIVALSISDSNYRPLKVTFKDLGTHK